MHMPIAHDLAAWHCCSIAGNHQLLVMGCQAEEQQGTYGSPTGKLSPVTQSVVET